jgi:diacylglycerol kinase
MMPAHDSLRSGVAEFPDPVDLAPGLVPGSPEDGGGRRRRRPWRDKFKCAFRGLKLGIRGHSSFAVHFFFAALVLAAAAIFKCDLLEWCVLLGCIGLVLTAELFNSALETLFRELDEATRDRAWPALDVAAGAVLLASITAAVIGSIIFLRHLALLLWP